MKHLFLSFMVWSSAIHLSFAAEEGVLSGELRDLATGDHCPLETTRVHGDVTGIVSSVSVTQVFRNPFEHAIEAVYAFPLPHRASVYDMTIRTGDRRIRARIQRRNEARINYERAKTDGRLAALFEQERDNIFVQSVANVLPGESVEITLRYFHAIETRWGVYEVVIPTVVGPRFDGVGSSPMPSEMRAGHEIAIGLTLSPASIVRDVSSPTHAVDIESSADGHVTVSLEPHDTIPNKDFVLRYRLADDETELVTLPYRVNGDGCFLMMIQPERRLVRTDAPREIIFVVDSSGSMSGTPLTQVKEAMTYALYQLGPQDRFQILRFSNTVERFAPSPVDGTPARVLAGVSYVEGLTAGGGTILLDGVREAFEQPPDPERLRVIAFMTDGYIGNEASVLQYIGATLRDERIFGFGVGSAPNRHLLDGMAEFGGGHTEYVLPRDPPTRAMERFLDTLRRPILEDLRIDWGGLDVTDLEPVRLSDLVAGKPLLAYGRYARPGSGVVTLEGRDGHRLVRQSFHVTLPRHASNGSAIAKMWARERVRSLTREEILAPDPSHREAITHVALEHRLVTDYTSFVAIEDTVVTDGMPRRVDVPVELPFGMTPIRVSSGGMSFSTVDVWNHMGTTARTVHFALVLMSIAALSVLIERWLTFRGYAVHSRTDRALRQARYELSHGLRSLISIGLTAPLVGLLGMVQGLLNAFRGMSLVGSGGLGAVSAGLAEALVPFAFGLAVGILAIWCYAYLRARVETLVLLSASARP